MTDLLTTVERVSRRRNPNGPAWSATLAVAMCALASLVPFLFLVAVSLEPAEPGAAVGSLWLELFDRMPVGLYMMNSAIVTLTSTILVTMISCAAGFAFAKLAYPGRGIVFVLVLIAISIPGGTTLLPNYLNLSALGGVGSYWAPILLYTAGSLPFATILMTSFFRSIPDELVESGVVDGASYRRIFIAVMVPMAVPAMVTVGVISFLGGWNDLLTGLLYLPDPDMRTISVGVSALQGVRIANLNVVLTGSLVSAIPPVVAFVIFQRHIISGITAGIAK